MPFSRKQPWQLLTVLVMTMAGFGGAIFYSERVAAKLDANAVSIATDASVAIDHLSAANTEVLRLQSLAVAAIERDGHDLNAFSQSIETIKHEFVQYADVPLYSGEPPLFAVATTAIAELETQANSLARGFRNQAEARKALLSGFSPAASQASVALERLIAFNAAELRTLAAEIPTVRKRASRREYLLVAAFAMFGAWLMILIAIETQRYTRLLKAQRRLAEERAAALTAFSTSLQAVHRAVVAIARSIFHGGQNQVFATIADEARGVVGADYALLCYGADLTQPFDHWVFAGMSPAEQEAVGADPRAVFEDALAAERPLRLAHLDGFPGGPPLGPVLAVPVSHSERRVGVLLLVRKLGSPVFSEDDEHVAGLLAAYIAISVENARLFNHERAVVRSREELLAVVSHDLRNPLGAIRMAAEMMARPLATAEARSWPR